MLYFETQFNILNVDVIHFLDCDKITHSYNQQTQSNMYNNTVICLLLYVSAAILKESINQYLKITKHNTLLYQYTMYRSYCCS